MTTAAWAGSGASAREIHDRLEDAYRELSRSSTRFFERVTPAGAFCGFRGLDEATMNRVMHVTARDADELDALLADADAYFTSHGTRWSVNLTPWARPPDVERLLGKRGFNPVARLAVMLHDPSSVAPRLASPPPSVVREAHEDEMGLFTSVIVQAFGMPARYFGPLTDVNRDWVRAGARAFFACVRDRPVATLLYAQSKGVSGIYSVGTLRAHRGRGLATALVDAAMRAHEESGNEHLCLQVARGSSAEAFYARRGFRAQYDWTFLTRP